MTTEFYTDLRDGVADELITDFGKALTLREEDDAAVFDGATGFITSAGTPTDHAVTGIITRFKLGDIDGTMVLRTDFKVLLSAVSPVTGLPITPPTVNMILIDGADQYTIIDVVPLRPGGVDVIYTMQVRQ